MKDTQIGKEEMKLSLLVDAMFYVENPKESTKATKTMTEFNRTVGFKVNVQSITVFL